MRATAATASTDVEAFYVLMVLGRHRFVAAGPYPTRAGAERIKGKVRALVDSQGVREFYALQVGAYNGPAGQAPVGKFNRAGILPKGKIR